MQELDYLESNRDRHIEELRAFLSIPSVSTRSEHAGDVQAAADFVVQQLRAAGLEAVEKHSTPGHPVVTGHTKPVAGAPTVLIYGHYDVQPAEPLELWKTPPFVPDLRDGKLYARGAADDKGQVFIYLKVLEAFHQVRGGCPVNVKVLIEGEEEIGSPNLVPFLKAHKKELACDVVLVSDTHMMGYDTPSITVGLRGLTSVEVTVQGASGDLHSGTYGGSVANPIQVLCEMLVACKNPRTGKILIPGFYDDVRRLSAQDRRKLAEAPHDDEKFRSATGAPALFGEKGFSTIERIGARPTFEVNGIWGGYMGEGLKTVLPSQAHAKISMRLVPDQDPQSIAKATEAFLKEIAPPHVNVTVTRERNQGDAIWVDADFPAMQVARDAVRKVFGTAPHLTLEGGSIPIVANFKKVLRRDTILLGFGLPDDRLHAPNEKFDLRMLDRGMKTVAHLLNDLATA
ncbi:MAG: dipeptidase [Deltaproteobacteria bacterium]|nr:dipeptidase [Deltaproteobacteria bacterium]